ncbi:sensor histidine kinase [Paenibacillus sp. TAB 01]|uniref:sensor histidine kinase n=1 Tax=Paenibacillus sp. TAB 01 TaxID=3368988 RepID=UPI0037507C95
MIVFSFVLGLSIIVSYVIASRFSIPIRRLYVSMKKVEMGDLSERSTIRGSDEVGELAQKFNRMVARIEELRDKVIEEQQLKRRTELQNLQSQINTHFLYNTLASIRSLLLTDTPAKVDSVIVALVKLLRKTLSAESEYIPIAEELDNLRNYVHIQMARQYGELFVEFDIEERIEPYGTLKLLLQPIVENAIFHGIEPKNGPGRIIVKGWMEGDNVRFRIRDDGVGIALAEGPDGAKTLTEQMLSSAGGMGLRNVQHRMRLHFGDSYGIEVHSLLEGGTAIDLTWPVFIRIEELKRK